jgi:hypothetical protein
VTSPVDGRGGMRFAVESWAPEYGAPVGAETLEPTDVDVNPGIEVAPADWAPRRPAGVAVAGTVRFVDGVRRIDASVWITGEDGTTRPGIAASYAAGVVCCDGAAHVERCEVRRAVFSAAPSLAAVVTRHGEYRPCTTAGDAAEQLSQELQQQMGRLEALVASEAPPADLLVLDGPLNRVPSLDGAIGYVKTHHKTYLPAELTGVVGALQPGERTPLFVTTRGWSRYSWYLRLPCAAPPAHAWAGVVRCEASGDLAPAVAAGLADRVTATLPRYASAAYKDPRAPQNLHPIAELERALRHRMGDPRVMERALRAAAG